MTIEKALKLFENMENDTFAQNLIAQANAKNILLEVNNLPIKFPNFTEDLDEKINSIAFSYLSIACTLKENQVDNEIALKAFEKAGDMIHYIHLPQNNRKLNSNYYLLISSLSLYISSQYSKSFIVIKKAETNTVFTKLIGLFLRKDLDNLVLEINNVLLNNKFTDTTISSLGDKLEENFRVYTVILSKSLNLLVEYIHSGDEKWLNLAKEYIYDLKELSSIDDDPASWWISRLFIILLDTYEKYSFWNILPSIIKSEKTNVYIKNLAYNNPSIIELFHTQYKAIKSMQNGESTVISLPTSSGKTRIAEISILETLVKFPESKILYLAPFRSLCYEVEESMNKVFSPLGFNTTFLYGGAQYSKIDKMLIENSNIIIATPEKAKAIIRAEEKIADDIKLLVIDEGHLLGTDKRLIKNELFIEELKYHIDQNEGKIILLSAVLPNTKDISKWISNNEGNIFESEKRLSNQRFGVLKWTKAKTINIEWLGKPNSFNNNFIEKFLPLNARTKYFPNDKNDGFASTALKLSKLGTVLLFIAQPRYIIPNAKRILKSMDQSKEKMRWKNQTLFKSFRLTCEEAGENQIFELAEYGILCHHGKLSTEVRILLEKIMREEKPKVIVSTTTLGQGINIGISTVIFADIFMNHLEEIKIDSKDFWNIAGRAGRAFTDTEGKILYGIDEAHWSCDRNKALCEGYFDISNIDKAKSGLLALIKWLKTLAIKCDVSFELLLQLITENNFSKLKIDSRDCSENILEVFDWIDDTLLALDYKKLVCFDNDSSEWIENDFRNSLAYIQAANEPGITQEEILQFLKARNKGVINIAGSASNWESLVKSGIPLSASIFIEKNIENIKEIIQIYNDSEQDINDTIELIKNIEKLIQQMPSTSFKHNFDENEIDQVREKWFSGISLTEIKEISNGQKICVKYFAMTIPWAINAIVRKLYDLNLEIEAEILENLTLFSEIGLPNIFAVKIYLSGIKSRVASLDLSKVINNDFVNISRHKLFKLIISHREEINKYCSPTTTQWIENFSIEQENKVIKDIPIFNSFNLTKPTESDILNVREYEGNVYLCSPDFKTKIDVTSIKTFPFGAVANNLEVSFKCDSFNTWTINKNF